MKVSKRKFYNWFREERGPTAVEYAVMVALIIVVSIGAISLIGGELVTIFTNLETGLPDGS